MFFHLVLFSLFRMFLDQRLCPGMGAKGVGPLCPLMSPLLRDLHPTCVRCRGSRCTADLTCDICKGWSVQQWEAFCKSALMVDAINLALQALLLPLLHRPIPLCLLLRKLGAFSLLRDLPPIL